MPAQWRGETSDGRSLYVRYRHGWLEAGLGNNFDEAVDAAAALDPSVPLYRAEIGGDLDGEIAEDEMLRQLAGVLLDGRNKAG
jgi:hypothetical protein